LHNSAKVDIKNIHGETPMDIALEKGENDIIDLLNRPLR
jgi:ankyrin repeat protein